MDEVVPGLWVGGVRAAMDVSYLSHAGITHIITCMKQQIPVPPRLEDGRTITRAEMKHVRIDDDEKAPILVHFAGCNEWIARQLQEEWIADSDTHSQVGQDDDHVELVAQLVQGRQKRGGRWGSWQTTGAGTVLVHCQAGCSRSVAIVAAYLMHTRRISAVTAIDMIQRRRSDAEPNRGFVAQLELYEQVGFEIDMKYQAVRRFLMSKTDILNGDSMDDMLLSYYPSPYPSPALNASGIKELATIRQEDDDNDAVAAVPKSCHNANQNQSQHQNPNPNSNSNSTALLNENSALAKHKPLLPCRSASCCSTSCHSCTTVNTQRIGDVCSTRLAPSAVDQVDRYAASDRVESLCNMSNASSNSNSNSSSTTEVKVTANSSGRLPGGVDHVRGHEGVLNRGSLAQPKFSGPKLRCKACRRELAALDHVVIHEPGKGQMAFEHRKRDVGYAGPSVVTNGADASESSVDRAMQPPRSNPTTDVRMASVERESGSAAASTSTVSSRPKIQSGASLALQLAPHLAALRGARPRAVGDCARETTRAQQGTAHSASTTSLKPGMLIHASCSSYFVEPMEWMSSLSSGQVTGRLDCPSPKCGAKLGSWDWAGIQCACGAWVTPAFSLHRSKVDQV